ncbi:MAG: glycosyltransferase family protein [Nevskiales bacterium]
MRILYGVMGYGRGHAMRVAAVLPELQKRHEVWIAAGADAYQALQPRFRVEEIPTIGYAYGRGQHISPWVTIKRNLRPMHDLLVGGIGRLRLDALIRDFRPDLIISDSEAWTHNAGRRWGIPRISFDHVGIMAYCRPECPPGDRLLARRDGFGYRLLMGWPERVLISSFYPAPPRDPRVELIGPVLRDLAYQISPRAGGSLLCYLNKGAHQFSSAFEDCLRALPCKVKIYGTPKHGTSGNLVFKSPSEQHFLIDLASCRAVLATAGHQLLSEAIHYSKPVFALPENCFEQRLNAHMVEKLGIGRRGDWKTLTPQVLKDFLADSDRFDGPLASLRSDGRQQAVTTLEKWITELTLRPQSPVAAFKPQPA